MFLSGICLFLSGRSCSCTDMFQCCYCTAFSCCLLEQLLSAVCCCLVWCWSGLDPLLTIWSLLLSCMVLVRSCSTTYYLESVAVLCGAGQVLLHYLLSGVCCCLVWCWSGLALLLTIWSLLLSCVVLVRSCSTTYYLESVAVLCGAGLVLLHYLLSGVCCCLVWCWSGLAPLLTIWSLLLSCVVLVRSCSTTYYLESVAVLWGAGQVLLHYLLSGVCCCLVGCWSGLAPLLTIWSLLLSCVCVDVFIILLRLQ